MDQADYDYEPVPKPVIIYQNYEYEHELDKIYAALNELLARIEKLEKK